MPANLFTSLLQIIQSWGKDDHSIDHKSQKIQVKFVCLECSSIACCLSYAPWGTHMYIEYLCCRFQKPGWVLVVAGPRTCSSCLMFYVQSLLFCLMVFSRLLFANRLMDKYCCSSWLLWSIFELQWLLCSWTMLLTDKVSPLHYITLSFVSSEACIWDSCVIIYSILGWLFFLCEDPFGLEMFSYWCLFCGMTGSRSVISIFNINFLKQW